MPEPIEGCTVLDEPQDEDWRYALQELRLEPDKAYVVRLGRAADPTSALSVHDFGRLVQGLERHFDTMFPGRRIPILYSDTSIEFRVEWLPDREMEHLARLIDAWRAQRAGSHQPQEPA